MGLTWQRSGDPLGDFLRLVFLLEETLERLGAWPEGTLGEKVKAVEGYLAEWGGSGRTPGTPGTWRPTIPASCGSAPGGRGS